VRATYDDRVPRSTNDTYDLVDATWDPRATVRPSAVDDDAAEQEDLGHHTLADALDLREKLGEGGMGVVHLAVQRSLDREVAVKTLRGGSPVAVRRLLREAWVTGALEHPNIVPVYDLGRDEDGRPRLVLKRIEGSLWSELIAAPGLLRRQHGVSDPLDWHLRTLAQLCNAVAFAHDRGVIHRDLKPDNVMIGAYGEVYLLDWGLAMAVDEAVERLPHAGRRKRFAGTPAYLAPEQLAEVDEPLGIHTDVYLLGGMLFEVLHGAPPHRGLTLDEVLQAATRPVPIDDDVPAPLASLLAACLAPSPSDRPASAMELRNALLAYLEQRHARQLAEQTADQLAALEEALARGEEAPDDDVVAASIRDLLGACRFGFGQALQMDPDNELARRGLATALTGVARRALARGELGAAALLLDELDESPADLVQALADARREREELEARRRALERDLDPTVGVRWRVLSLLAVSASWIALPVVAFWPLGTEVTWTQVWVEAALLSVVAVVLTVAGRSQFRRTAVNRVLRGVTVLAPVSQAIFFLGAQAMALAPGQGLALSLGGWGVMSLMGAIWYGPGVMPVSAAYVAAFVAGSASPRWAPVAMVVANLVFMVNMTLYRLPALREARRRWEAQRDATDTEVGPPQS